jgi:hypothetical protein
MTAESRRKAFAALKPWHRYKLATVYDREDFPVWALYELCPGFEYPEWDWRLVVQFVRWVIRREAEQKGGGS